MADRSDGDTLLLALHHARPEPGDETFDPTTPAAQALLNHLLSDAREPLVATAPRGSWPSVRRQLALSTLGVAALTAGLIGGVGLTGRTPHAHPTATPGRSPHPAAGTVRLAGYTFSLPPGYNATAKPCGKPFTPPVGATAVRVSPPPVVGGDSYTRAASADGGCVEAALGTGHPLNAQPVRFGTHTGFLWRTNGTIRGGLLTLYVELPPSASASVGMDPGLDLFLDSTNLTATQLEQIAVSGLGG